MAARAGGAGRDLVGGHRGSRGRLPCRQPCREQRNGCCRSDRDQRSEGDARVLVVRSHAMDGTVARAQLRASKNDFDAAPVGYSLLSGSSVPGTVDGTIVGNGQGCLERPSTADRNSSKSDGEALESPPDRCSRQSKVPGIPLADS